MILVCGGAGYIGSHAVRQLIDRGEEVIIVDNLETGHEDAIHPQAKFYKVDIRDEEALDKAERLLEYGGLGHTAVIHSEDREKILQFSSRFRIPCLYF